MADISKLTKLVSGIHKEQDLAANTLVTLSVKVGGGSSNTELTKSVLDAHIAHVASTSNPHSVTKAQILTGNLIVNADVSDTAAIAESKLSLTYSTSSLNTAIGGKEPTIAAGTTSQYWRGDKSWQTLDKSAVGLSNLDNVQQLPMSYLDTDGTLAANSDSKVASQKAVKTYVASAISSNNYVTSVSDTSTIDLTVTAGALTADIVAGSVANSHIATGAAIAYSKLSLSGSIVNADVATGAAIAYSKLSLSGSVVNADIATGAAIAESKLSLTYSTSSLKSDINNLSSLISNFEWKNSVLDRLATPPGSPATGARYLVIATATGAWVGKEDQIAEWDGAAWVYTVCATGTYLAIDDENDGLYLFGGSSWAKKYFEATTASVGLEKVGFDIRIANAVATNGISITSGAISAVVDSSSIEINGSAQLQVKALGITNAMLAGSIAYSKLSIADGDLTIAKTSGLQTALDDKVVKNSAITGATKTKITYDAKGLVTAGADATTDDIQESGTPTNKYFTDARAKAAAVADSITNGVTDVAPSQNAVYDALALKSDTTHVHESIVKTMVAGEEFLAGTYFVRVNSAGKVVKADYDASTNNYFYAYGAVVVASTIAADANIVVTLLGEITLGASFFEAGEVGLPVHLKATGLFDALSQISYSADQASYRVGIVTAVNKILVGNFQLLGIA